MNTDYDAMASSESRANRFCQYVSRVNTSREGNGSDHEQEEDEKVKTVEPVHYSDIEPDDPFPEQSVSQRDPFPIRER